MLQKMSLSAFLPPDRNVLMYSAVRTCLRRTLPVKCGRKRSKTVSKQRRLFARSAKKCDRSFQKETIHNVVLHKTGVTQVAFRPRVVGRDTTPIGFSLHRNVFGVLESRWHCVLAHNIQYLTSSENINIYWPERQRASHTRKTANTRSLVEGQTFSFRSRHLPIQRSHYRPELLGFCAIWADSLAELQLVILLKASHPILL